MKQLQRLLLLALALLLSISAISQNKKGSKAPEWTAKDRLGNEVSLSQYKGKYVIIDVWASWCGPCRAEAPHYAKLAEEFKGKNIQFISISLDSKIKSWERIIQHEVSPSLQLIDTRAESSPLARDYQINSIPRFIIINPKGEIEEWTAPRPSDPRLKEILKKLLK